MTTSPTFVAEFENGDSVVVTRMTVHKPGARLNIVRGVRLARAAYKSQMKKAPPAIISAHYESDGEIVETITRTLGCGAMKIISPEEPRRAARRPHSDRRPVRRRQDLAGCATLDPRHDAVRRHREWSAGDRRRAGAARAAGNLAGDARPDRAHRRTEPLVPAA